MVVSKDDGVRCHSLLTKKERARRRCITHGIRFSSRSCRAVCAGRDGGGGRGLEGECSHRRRRRETLLPVDDKKNKHAADYSLTVFVSVPGADVLLVLVVMGGVGGSFRLPKTITTTATTAAIATKTDPSTTTLNLDILCTSVAS